MNFRLESGINFGGTDEWYTPSEAVEVLLKYLKPGATILCPFDTAESNYVKVFRRNGFNVKHSHIREGADFFELEKPDVDYVISNPPYSKRQEILQRLYEWDIPFAMLFNTNGLFDSKKRAELARGGRAEVLVIYPRIEFIDINGERNHATFQSCYWCRNILPEKMILEPLDGQISLL